MLERQVLLEPLAADHSDPRGRHRPQPGGGRGSDADPAPGHAGIPQHPAGHARERGGVRSFQDFFDTDRMSFGTVSPFSGTTRTFRRFSDALKELLDARVWGGIHLRTADVQGAVIGRRVARWSSNHFFLPV